MVRRTWPNLRLGRLSLGSGLGWLVLLPAVAWAVASQYMPLFAPGLGEFTSWAVGVSAALLLLASVVAHTLAHAGAARLLGAARPARLWLGPLGDAAQAWPVAPSPWAEATGALAGPLASVLLAGAAYLVWDQQWHPWLNIGLPLVIVVNLVIAALNLAPGFPLDGGRLARAITWGLLGRPDQATRVATVMGWLIVTGLAAWGGALTLQSARFHLEVGLATLAVAGLLALLRLAPTWRWQTPPPRRRWSPAQRLGRVAIAGLLGLGLLAPPASLLPTLDGLLAPGRAIAVEPMIAFEGPVRQQHAGRFLLTSVITQTPIVAGQWLQGQVDPTVTLVPPERIVPPDTSPRQAIARSASQLEDSTITASVVALRLAGYTPRLTGDGATIVSIAPDSPSTGLLQPGDRVVGLDAMPVATAADLVAAVRQQSGQTSVDALVERDGQSLTLVLPLLPPARAGDPPRLGVSIETTNGRADLPFPVQITPQRIVGGPSAGLMFTLTLYNLLSPEDITGGQSIAGTGTIDMNGTVGPIGGVSQKVAAAEQAGARYFLAPRGNADEARRVARTMTVVPVATAAEAIAALRRLSAAP
ncbi:MAG: PDZ domain-containing protein [Chloroflexi bacterium]|nr:PDZ domain-containing protein [Chloroflexota bacterium]